MSRLSFLICLTTLIFNQQGKAQWLEKVAFGNGTLQPPAEHLKCKTFKGYNYGQLFYINHFNKTGQLVKVEYFKTVRQKSKLEKVIYYQYDSLGRKESCYTVLKSVDLYRKYYDTKLGSWLKKKELHVPVLGNRNVLTRTKFTYYNNLVLTVTRDVESSGQEIILDSINAFNTQDPIRQLELYGLGTSWSLHCLGNEKIKHDTGWSFDAFYEMLEWESSYHDSLKRSYGTIHHIYDTTLYSFQHFLQQEIKLLGGGYTVVQTRLADSNHFNLSQETSIALTPDQYLKWHSRNFGKWHTVDQEYGYVPDVELPCWFHNSQTGDSTLMLLNYEGHRTVRRNANGAIVEREYYATDNGYYREMYTYLPHGVVGVSSFHPRFAKSEQPINAYSEYRFADSFKQFFLFANRKQVMQKRQLAGEPVEVIFTIRPDSICCDTLGGFTLLFHKRQEIWSVGAHTTHIKKVTDSSIVSYYVDYPEGRFGLQELVDSIKKLPPKDQRGYESKPNKGLGGSPYPFTFWAKNEYYERLRHGKNHERVPDSLLPDPSQRATLEWRIRMSLFPNADFDYDRKNRLKKGFSLSDTKRLQFEIEYYD